MVERATSKAALHDALAAPLGHGIPTRRAVRTRLAALEPELRVRKVASLSLFGSVARDKARIDSDIDVMVGTVRPFGILDLSALIRYLENQMGRPVDVLLQGDANAKTPVADLRPRMREAVLRDLTPVF